MRKNWRRSWIGMLAAIGIGNMLAPISVKADSGRWEFEYTGNVQEFTVPYTALYKVELLGAEGGSFLQQNGEMQKGGKGGKVSACLLLNKGEKVYITVGGCDGYNGGGKGSTSNGGGATDIRIMGDKLSERILVAGGGGGANGWYPGGDGGTESSGTQQLGQGSDTSEGAGGGGGFYGGISGIQRIRLHNHAGDESAGGTCYKPVYHKHSGNAEEGGGCYNVPTFHRHKGDVCYEPGTWCVWGKPYLAGGIEPAWVSICGCGKTIACKTEAGCPTGNHEYHKGALICDKTENETIEFYNVGCGKNNNTVERYELCCEKMYDEYEVSQALGGTNGYAEWICSDVTSECGVHTGNGLCRIKLMGVFRLYYEEVASRNVYYDGIETRRIFYNGELVYSKGTE